MSVDKKRRFYDAYYASADRECYGSIKDIAIGDLNVINPPPRRRTAPFFSKKARREWEPLG